MNRKEHWENIYSTKSPLEVSWYQPVPQHSLDCINAIPVSKDASIIDVGGGDSLLVDKLLTLGYTDITVLDISHNAIARAKSRLSENAERVKWIVSDVTEFIPMRKYDLWHDRATFHFLRDSNDIKSYKAGISQSLKPKGHMIIGTFSKNGPLKCSGIEIQQYSSKVLTEIWQKSFDKIDCHTINHTTPFNTVQNFLFCTFINKSGE